MPVFGFGHETCTSTTRPASPSLGQLIYQTDTDEYLKYVTDVDGTNRWMQAIYKPHRRVNLNGDFRIWQRGTTRASAGSGITTFAADRYCFGNNNTAQYVATQQATGPRGDLLYAMRVAANATVTNGLNGVEHLIETADTIPLRGQRLTLSFWVRGSKNDFAGNAYGFESGTAEANPGVGNGLTGAASLATGTVAVTTSWQKVVLTSTGTVANNAALIRISLPRPTNFVNGDWIEYAGVQLEAGTAPSDYELRFLPDELRRCQRYYQVVVSSEIAQYQTVGSVYTTNQWIFAHYYAQVPMRSRGVPSDNATTAQVINNSLLLNAFRAGGQIGSSISVDYYYPDLTGIGLRINGHSGTGGQACHLDVVSGSLALTAEIA